jgi:hypothetical protein
MTGIDLIALERQRQIVKEGWTNEHDDFHDEGELAIAAACYATTDTKHYIGDIWPFEKSWWKPSEDPIRNLQKAGALIAAEIDRQMRLKYPKQMGYVPADEQFVD